MILAIDTALNHCSVALLNKDDVLFHKSLPAKNTQSELLPSLVSEALKAAKSKASDLEKIAVTIGPGSFNGVRIGLGFAKSLAMALKIECIGVSTLGLLLGTFDSKSKTALIETNGAWFLETMDAENNRLGPMRIEYAELQKLDLSKKDEVSYIGSSKLPFEYKAIKQEFLNPIILAKMAQHLNQCDFPPAPLYLRSADAKLWAGSQYV